jgi:hypothetical protein
MRSCFLSDDATLLAIWRAGKMVEEKSVGYPSKVLEEEITVAEASETAGTATSVQQLQSRFSRIQYLVQG